jgi:3-methyladenine DNA glycosylase AlkD
MTLGKPTELVHSFAGNALGGGSMNEVHSPALVAREIRDELARSASAAATKSGKRFFKEPVALLGVKAADMHALARRIHHAAGKSLTIEAAQEVCNLLLPEKHTELKITAALFLGRFHKHLDKSVFTSCQRWINLGWCDSWAIIDTFGIYVLGPVLERAPELAAGTRSWRKSRNQWLRRAAAVALVKPVRRGQLLDEAQAGMVPLLHDPEDLVQKAVGWLLRESGKTDMRRLAAFLGVHGTACARTTLRYAIERFPAVQRARILAESRA